MTSATFSDKQPDNIRLRRVPLRFFSWSLRKNILIAGIASILALLVSPGIPLMTYYTYVSQSVDIPAEYLRNAANIEDSLSTIAVLLSILTGLMVLVLSSLNYRYMHGKAASDLFHALPITRSRMLLGRFLSVFLMSMVPAAVGLCGLAAAVALTPLTGLSAALFCKNLAALAVLCFACAAFTALIAVSTGSSFDMFAALLVTNIGWPVICLLFSGLCQSQLVGFPGLSLSLQDELYFLFSPFGRLLGFSFWANGSSDAWFQDIGQAGRFFGVWILLSLAFLATALLLYKRRKGEAAGSPYAFRYLPIALQVISAAIGGAVLGILFGMGGIDTLSFYIFMAVGAVLGGLIPGAIFSRGFKKIKRDLIVAGCVFLTMLAITGVVSSGGLGYETRVPPLSSINSVSLDFHTDAVRYASSYSVSSDYAATAAPVPTVTQTAEPLLFTEQTDIQNVHSLHKAVAEWLSANKQRHSGIRSYDTLGDADPTGNDPVIYISLTYHTKWGGTVSRQYSLRLTAFEEELAPIFSSRSYLRAAYPEVYSAEAFQGYPAATVEDANTLNTFTSVLTADELEALRAAYEQDLSAQSLLQRQLYTVTLRPVSMSEARSIALPVYEGSGNTLNYLRKAGYIDRLRQMADTEDSGQQPVLFIPEGSLSALDEYEGQSNLSLLAYLYNNQVPVGVVQDNALAYRFLYDHSWYSSLEQARSDLNGGAIAVTPDEDPYSHTLFPGVDWPEGVQAAPLTEQQYQDIQYAFTRASRLKG